jgi:hypothetical protein
MLTKIDQLNNKEWLFLISLTYFIFGLIGIYTFQESVYAGFILESLKTLPNEKYYTNLQSEYLGNEYSLQYIITFFIAKTGLSIFITSRLVCGLLTLISMLSVYFFCLFFSNSRLNSFVISFLLCLAGFVATRTLNLGYPNLFFNFGQFGIYLTILGISLYLLNYKSFSLKIGFFLIFIHFVWSIFYFFFIFVMIFFEKEKITIKKKDIIFYLISIFLIITLSIYFFYQTNFFDTMNNLSRNIGSKLDGFDFLERQMPILFYNDHFQFRTFLRFIIYDILIILLFFYLKKEIDLKQKRFFYFLFICIGLVYFWLFFHVEILNIFTDLISKNFSDLVMRAAPTRYLIINNILAIALILSVYINSKTKLIEITKPYFFILILIISLTYLNTKISFSFLISSPYILIPSILDVLIFLILILMILTKNKKINSFLLLYFNKIDYIKNKNHLTNFKFICLFVLILHFSFKSLQNTREQNKIENYFSNKKDNSKIILSSGIHGHLNILGLWNYNLIFLTEPKFNHYNTKMYEEIFCKNKNIKFLDQGQLFTWINNVCFVEKSEDDWREIKEKYSVNHIITKSSDKKLNSKKVLQTKNYKIYKIQ